MILGEALTKHCGVAFDTEHIVSGKGGFWVRGHGFFSYAKARLLTGVAVEHSTRDAKLARSCMINRAERHRVSRPVGE